MFFHEETGSFYNSWRSIPPCGSSSFLYARLLAYPVVDKFGLGRGSYMLFIASPPGVRMDVDMYDDDIYKYT